MELLLQATRTQNHARRMGAVRRHGRRLRPRGSVVHGSALELWKALEQFELFSITVSQA